jgi:hypothetical protein
VRNRSLVEAVKRCEAAPETEAFVAAVERLVLHAQAAGAVRADVDALDVLRLVPAASAYPEIVLSGLRPPSPR